MKKIWSVAIRGRPVTTVQQYNSTTVQQLELGSDKYAFCITTVSKDSMVLIINGRIDKDGNGKI